MSHLSGYCLFKMKKKKIMPKCMCSFSFLFEGVFSSVVVVGEFVRTLLTSIGSGQKTASHRVAPQTSSYPSIANGKKCLFLCFWLALFRSGRKKYGPKHVQREPGMIGRNKKTGSRVFCCVQMRLYWNAQKTLLALFGHKQPFILHFAFSFFLPFFIFFCCCKNKA